MITNEHARQKSIAIDQRRWKSGPLRIASHPYAWLPYSVCDEAETSFTSGSDAARPAYCERGFHEHANQSRQHQAGSYISLEVRTSKDRVQYRAAATTLTEYECDGNGRLVKSFPIAASVVRRVVSMLYPAVAESWPIWV